MYPRGSSEYLVAKSKDFCRYFCKTRRPALSTNQHLNLPNLDKRAPSLSGPIRDRLHSIPRSPVGGMYWLHKVTTLPQSVVRKDDWFSQIILIIIFTEKQGTLSCNCPAACFFVFFLLDICPLLLSVVPSSPSCLAWTGDILYGRNSPEQAAIPDNHRFFFSYITGTMDKLWKRLSGAAGDSHFGPTPSVYNDLTLKFEDTIFTTGPASLLLALLPFYIWRYRYLPVITAEDPLIFLKLVSCSGYLSPSRHVRASDQLFHVGSQRPPHCSEHCFCCVIQRSG